VYRILRLASADLLSNSNVMTVVKTIFEYQGSNDTSFAYRISYSYLAQQCSLREINLLSLMTTSLTNRDGNEIDVAFLASILDSVTVEVDSCQVTYYPQLQILQYDPVYFSDLNWDGMSLSEISENKFYTGDSISSFTVNGNSFEANHYDLNDSVSKGHYYEAPNWAITMITQHRDNSDPLLRDAATYCSCTFACKCVRTPRFGSFDCGLSPCGRCPTPPCVHD
jgi:hypothetical protein